MRSAYWRIVVGLFILAPVAGAYIGAGFWEDTTQNQEVVFDGAP